MDRRLQKLYGGFDGRRIGNGRCRAGLPALCQTIQSLRKCIEILAASCGDSGGWDAQFPGEKRKIDLDAALLCLIHQVDAYERFRTEFQNLQSQAKAPLQAGSAADGDDGFGPAEAQKIPGDLFFGGMGLEGIGAWRICDPVRVKSCPEGAGGLFHSLARPVSGMLPKARQGIEKRAFSHIWIAGQGDGDLLGAGTLYQDILAVPVPDGDDSAADQESVGVAGRAVSHAGDVCMRPKPQIQETAPQGAGAENFFYAGRLSRF